MPRWVKVSVPDPQGLQKALPPERDPRSQNHHRHSPSNQRILAAIPATSSGSEGEDAITGVPRRHHHHHHHHPQQRRRPRIAVQSSPPPSKRRLVYGLAVMVIVVMVSCCLAFLLSGTESLLSSPVTPAPNNVTSAKDSSRVGIIQDVPDYHENHSYDGGEESSSETVISRLPDGPQNIAERDRGDFFADLMDDSSPVESVNRPVVVKRNWTNAHGQSVTDSRPKSQVRYADRAKAQNVELSRRQYEETSNKRRASKTKNQPSTPTPLKDDKGRAFRDRWINGPPSLRGTRLPIQLPTRRGPVPAYRPGFFPGRLPPASGVPPYSHRPQPRPYGSRQEPIVRPELIEFFEKNPHLLEKLLNDTVSQAEAMGVKGDLPPIDLLSWMTSEYYSFVENQPKSPTGRSQGDSKSAETKMDRAGMPVAGRQIMPLPPPPPGWRRRPLLIARRAEGRRIPIILPPPPQNYRRRPVRQEPAALRDGPERPRSRRKKHSLYSYPASASSIQDILQYLKNEYGTSSTSHREFYDEHPDTYAQGFGYRNGYKSASKNRKSHVSYVEDEGIPLYEDDDEFGPDVPLEDERRYGGAPKSQPKRPFEVMLDVYPVKNKPSSSSSAPTASYNPDDYYRQDASQHSQAGRDRNNGHHVVLHLNLYSKKPSGSPSYYRKRRRLFDSDEQKHRDSEEYDTSSSVSTPGHSPPGAALPSGGWAQAIPQTDTTTTTDPTDHTGTSVSGSSVQTTSEPETTSGTSGELSTSGPASSSSPAR